MNVRIAVSALWLLCVVTLPATVQPDGSFSTERLWTNVIVLYMAR